MYLGGCYKSWDLGKDTHLGSMEQRRCIWEVVTELGSGKGHPLRQHGTEKVYLGGCDKSSDLGKDTHLGSMEQRRCIWEVVTRVRIWERTPT